MYKELYDELSRDMFYELLKEWEKNENKQHGLNQREKMR